MSDTLEKMTNIEVNDLFIIDDVKLSIVEMKGRWAAENITVS